VSIELTVLEVDQNQLFQFWL